jgi:hypothetical protein
MPEKSTALQIAAESYVSNRLTLYPFPESAKQFRLLMEIAFMEGSQWYNRHVAERLGERVTQLRKEIVNAQS